MLVLVPQLQLRNDTISKIQTRLKEHQLDLSVGFSCEQDIMVLTNAAISRHYYKYSINYFDYIIIDEAHHAVAPMLSKVIQHFSPNTLMGLTATHERLDEKSLADVFGKYQESLSLKEAIEKELLSPIRAFRLQSNFDLSEVRFNGKDYVGTDLQRTLIAPSRDQLIVDVLNKYFSPKVNDFKSGI